MCCTISSVFIALEERRGGQSVKRGERERERQLSVQLSSEEESSSTLDLLLYCTVQQRRRRKEKGALLASLFLFFHIFSYQPTYL